MAWSDAQYRVTSGEVEEIRAFVREFQRMGNEDPVAPFFPPENVLRFVELVAQLDEASGGELPAGLHAAAFKIQTGRVAILERLVEELAAECDQRADADMQGDPPAYVPNFAMQLLTKIRAVVKR